MSSSRDSRASGDDGYIEISARLHPPPALSAQLTTRNGDELFILSDFVPLKIHFDVRHVYPTKVRFDKYIVTYREDNPYTHLTTSERDDLKSGGRSVWLQTSEEYTITVHLTNKDFFDQCGSVWIRIRFDFNVKGKSIQKFKYIRYCFVFDEDRAIYESIVTTNQDHDEDGWHQSAPYDWRSDNLTIIWLDNGIFYSIVGGRRGVEGGEDELDKSTELKKYVIPSDIKELGTWPVEALDKAPPGKLSLRKILGLQKLEYGQGQEYAKYFHNLLYLEELQHEIDLDYYAKHHVRLMIDTQRSTDEEPRLILRLPGLLEKRPSVRKGDRIFAIPNIAGNQFMYEGGVTYVSKANVFLYFHPKFWDELEEYVTDDRVTFKIHFRLNRLQFRYMHRAVDLAVENKLKVFLFPESVKPSPKRTIPDRIDFYDPKIRYNQQQMDAVKHIVCGTSQPAPYIIYGPPGTGKTFTLVEAIKQVHKQLHWARILVCASSNSAADLVTANLLTHIAPGNILRLNATTRPFESYDHKIRSVANISSSKSIKFVYPSKEKIELKSIVVCTLATAGRLVSANMKNHFTHLFIDEAGFATEPETLIPISLFSLLSDDAGQVVLAGDPKQLGPVIRSGMAEACGLGISLLKRLMDLKTGPYVTRATKRSKKKKFNPNFVTKLVKSYRSHPEILKLPNEFFYDGELEACADKDQREKFLTWQHLPEECRENNFPLIFHSVKFGHEQQDKTSPSWFNPEEIIEVKYWVDKLLPYATKTDKMKADNIGIITPYHQQVKKIRKALVMLDDLDQANKRISRNCRDIEVGSVEKFQGDEREVIIISTVRSDNDQCEKESVRAKLGFLTNEKRFNVAVTRAKALLIVVGNQEVLILDKHWRALIKLIGERGGYMGEPSWDELKHKIQKEGAKQEEAEQQSADSHRDHMEEEEKHYSEYQQMADDTWDPYK